MKNHTKLSLLVCTALLMAQCKKEPTVSTMDIKNVTHNSAEVSGKIADSKAAVNARGICYSTLPEPNIHNERAGAGSGSGAFKVNLSLMPGTTYYVRAYASTDKGTFYGDEKSFKTLNFNSFVYGESTIEVHPTDNALGGNWSAVTDTATNARSIDDGKDNTGKIAAFPMASMAKICNDLVAAGKDDWYLPSANELNAMYGHKVNLGLSPNLYWSSTEVDSVKAIAQDMSNGFQAAAGKAQTYSCRCIRKN